MGQVACLWCQREQQVVWRGGGGESKVDLASGSDDSVSEKTLKVTGPCQRGGDRGLSSRGEEARALPRQSSAGVATVVCRRGSRGHVHGHRKDEAVMGWIPDYRPSPVVTVVVT